MSNIASKVDALKMNLSHSLISAGQSFFKRGRGSGHAQHTASGSDKLATEARGA